MAPPKKSKPKIKRVTFTVRAAADSTVFLAGDFNQWSPTVCALTDPKGTGDFSVSIPLLPGQYEYKFVINGSWCVDPNCVDWVQNKLGTLNSVRRVE